MLSIDFDDFHGSLDSSRSGVIYQSETYSNIIKKRKQLNEQIIAVKVNGIDNKIGYNRANMLAFNFYNNLVSIGNDIVSPIAKSALLFYKYKLVESFTKDGLLIHKIKVIPRHKIGPVFNGNIFIVDGLWQIYALDLYVKGKQIQQPKIDFIKVNQTFSYSKKEELFLIDKQWSSFKFNEFKIKISGSFFSQYKFTSFNKNLVKKKFNNVVFSYQNSAFNKSNKFWEKVRPFRLDKKEKQEYKYKDSIYKIRTSKKYLDSVVAKKTNLFCQI